MFVVLVNIVLRISYRTLVHGFKDCSLMVTEYFSAFQRWLI